MSQLLEKPKQPQQQQRKKLSEIFYEADKEGIKQCRKHLSKITITAAGIETAYCAKGLLYHKLYGKVPSNELQDDPKEIAYANRIVYQETRRGVIITLNDTYNWSFKQFGDFFASVGQ